MKQRQDVNTGYLLEQVDSDRLLAPFRRLAGLPLRAEPYGEWEARDIAGHSLGHYLSALSLLYAATGDSRARERVEQIIDELAQCQAANGDGYLAPIPKRVFEEMADGRIDVGPFGLNKCWVPLYTIHKILAGLRDAYRLVGIGRALAVETAFAGYLLRAFASLSPEQVQTVLSCEHGGMAEVYVDLFEDTGESRFLDAAERYFHHRAVLDPLMAGRDDLDGLHANTQIPKVIGLARRFEASGDAACRASAEYFWRRVAENRSYANGGNSENEHFFPTAETEKHLTSKTTETCNSYNMLKLTKHLFSWNPDARYMDYAERVLLNHVAANIGRRGGEYGYFLSMDPMAVKVWPEAEAGWWCCVGTGMENPSRYAETFYAEDDHGIWINHFIASELLGPDGQVRLTLTTTFPYGETATIRLGVSEGKHFKLRLRRPDWCPGMSVAVNGVQQDVSTGADGYVVLERNWTGGDEIEVSLPMALRQESLPEAGRHWLATFLGPLLLAAITPPESGKADPAKLRFRDHLKAKGKTEEVPPVFVASAPGDILSGFRKSTANTCFVNDTTVVPGGVAFMPLMDVYEEHYSVYLPWYTPDGWQAESTRRTQNENDAVVSAESRICDFVEPGFQQSEVEHGYEGRNTTVGYENGRKYRRLGMDGQVEYTLSYDEVIPSSLMISVGSEGYAAMMDAEIGDKRVTSLPVRAIEEDGSIELRITPDMFPEGVKTLRICLRTAPASNSCLRLFRIAMKEM